MGGELLLGLRDRRGQVKLQLRWTNPMPFMIAHPTFLTGGALWNKIWNEKSSTKGWPRTVNVKTVQPSEYGVILIDLKDKIVFSRQDYCTPNMLHLQGTIDPEMAEVCLSKKESCTLTTMTRNRSDLRSYYIKPPKKLERAFWDTMLYGFESDNYVHSPAYFQLKWRMKGWKFDYGVPGKDRARYCWKEVQAFIAKNRWKTKVEDVKIEEEV